MSKKKNEEEKEATKNQEGKAGFAKDEMEATSIKAVAESNAETLNAESNDENAVHLNGDVAYLCTRRFLQTPAVPDAEYQEVDNAIIGLDIPPYYYFALFQMNLQNLSSAWEIPIEVLRAGKLKFTPQSLSDGRCSFQILNIYNEEVCRWDEYNDENSAIELNIADLLEPNSNLIEFAAISLPGVNGTVGFSIEDMDIVPCWGDYLEDLEITVEPTKKEYLVGESFDSAGMEVTARYSDGLSCPVSIYTMSVSGFNSDNVTDSQTVTINVTLGNCTDSYNLTISVDELKHEDAPYVRGSTTQVMDIHVPENLGNNVKVPAVITIHGGSWCGGDKGDYDYMTPFITNAPTAPNDYNNSEGEYIPGCNCVHVNMDYRLTTGTPGGNDITYEDMLEDIQSAIEYLQSHADIYHIYPNKIALMGYSAGGHLALLYAYKNPTQIDLVISEAGPTNFVEWNNNGQLILPDANVCAMAGVMNNDSETDKAGKLTNASPVTYANDSFPFTIYARGSNDSTIPVSQPIKLVKQLLPSYANVIDTSIEQALQSNSLADQANCAFFSFPMLGHNNFGEDANKNSNEIHPNSKITYQWRSIIEEYYTKIQNELNLLYRST